MLSLACQRVIGLTWNAAHCSNLPPRHLLPETKYAAHTEQPRPHRPSRLLIPLESHDLPACQAHASYTVQQASTSQRVQKNIEPNVLLAVLGVRKTAIEQVHPHLKPSTFARPTMRGPLLRKPFARVLRRPLRESRARALRTSPRSSSTWLPMRCPVCSRLRARAALVLHLASDATNLRTQARVASPITERKAITEQRRGPQPQFNGRHPTQCTPRTATPGVFERAKTAQFV